MKPVTLQIADYVLRGSKLVFRFITLALLLFPFFNLSKNTEAEQLICPERAIQKITDETGGSFVPSINAEGRRIAFLSAANITGDNPEGNFEIYLNYTRTGIFAQITNEMMGDSSSTSINSDGIYVAFRSEAKIGGGNPEGNSEIYIANTTTEVISQITDETTGFSSSPSINSEGTRIAFGSTADINNGNPEGNFEVYLYDKTMGIITQITDETMGNSGDALSLNAEGTRIAFQSTANINGGNLDGSLEVYLYDTTTGIFIQITDETIGSSGQPTLNADGTRIAFSSDSNINGGNLDGIEEIYLALCFNPLTARNIPTLSEWGLIAMAGVLGIIGLLALRRKKVAA